MRGLWLHSRKHQKICYLFSKIKLWRSVCSFLLHQPIQPYLLSHKIDCSLFSSIVIPYLLGFLISQSTLHEHNYSCTFYQITADFKNGEWIENYLYVQYCIFSHCFDFPFVVVGLCSYSGFLYMFFCDVGLVCAK